MILKKGLTENVPWIEDTQCCVSDFGGVWVLDVTALHWVLICKIYLRTANVNWNMFVRE